MNTLHYLDNGLERETCPLTWHSVAATVDTPLNPAHALASASVSRVRRQPFAIRPSPPQRTAGKPAVNSESKLRDTLRSRLSARQLGWDNWDKLSEL
jgi:hypothetical protein